MLLAAITFMAALILISKRTGHTGEEPAGTSRRVMSFDARVARELIIETPTSRFTFENKGTSWQITHPVNAPANPAPVLRILETVAELKWSARLDPRELRNGALDEKETGFDRPRARIQIATAAGRTNVLTFGNQAGSSRQSYVRTHLRDEIMVADHAVLDLIPDSVMAFRERKLLPFSPDAITRLECITLTNTFQMSRDRDNNWKLDRPVQARADGTAVREWLNAFYTFQILSFV